MVFGRCGRVLGALVAGLLLALSSPFASGAGAAPPPTSVPPPALPGTYVLVDADTGRIVAQSDSRTLHLPASTIKLLTALIAAERLPAGDVVPISALAESMPARKINVKAGQTWTLNDLMHCLLMVSANDAAVAIAERTGGSIAGWQKLAADAAARLGLADHPELGDPAGLDDQFAQGGGSKISARDLAIVARAVLSRPDLMAIIGTKEYSFSGGDGVGHKFSNHDLFLGLYEGATGMKTGTTDRAGSTFVGSAVRNGRTMLTVIFNGNDPYRQAALLLDQGFATPAASESPVDALPAVVADAAAPPTTTTVPAATGPRIAAAHQLGAGSSLDINSPPVAVAIFMAGLVGLALVRRVMSHRGLL